MAEGVGVKDEGIAVAAFLQRQEDVTFAVGALHPDADGAAVAVFAQRFAVADFMQMRAQALLQGVAVARVVGDFRGDVKQRRHARAVALGKRL